MNYDQYDLYYILERDFEARISNLCRDLIKQKAGGKVYEFDLEEEVWSMTDTILQSIQDSISQHLNNNIPSWKENND